MYPFLDFVLQVLAVFCAFQHGKCPPTEYSVQKFNGALYTEDFIERRFVFHPVPLRIGVHCTKGCALSRIRPPRTTPSLHHSVLNLANALI